MTQMTLEYLTHIPEAVPDGRVVVHNNVRPARRLGTRGFRAWLAKPSRSSGKPPLTVCDCSWAPELGIHYRVVIPDQTGTKPSPPKSARTGRA